MIATATDRSGGWLVSAIFIATFLVTAFLIVTPLGALLHALRGDGPAETPSSPRLEQPGHLDARLPREPSGFGNAVLWNSGPYFMHRGLLEVL